MIEHGRLATLRGRFADLRASYVRSGDDIRQRATEIGHTRANFLAMVAGTIVRERKRRNPGLPAITAGEVAADPAVVALAEKEEELLQAGVKADDIKALRAREIALARKRKQHEELGALVREWAGYMERAEELAAQYRA